MIIKSPTIYSVIAGRSYRVAAGVVDGKVWKFTFSESITGFELFVPLCTLNYWWDETRKNGQGDWSYNRRDHRTPSPQNDLDIDYRRQIYLGWVEKNDIPFNKWKDAEFDALVKCGRFPAVLKDIWFDDKGQVNFNGGLKVRPPFKSPLKRGKKK